MEATDKEDRPRVCAGNYANGRFFSYTPGDCLCKPGKSGVLPNSRPLPDFGRAQLVRQHKLLR